MHVLRRNIFEIDIQNYAVADFYSSMDIVDTLGGVEVNVQSSEIKELNKFMRIMVLNGS